MLTIQPLTGYAPGYAYAARWLEGQRVWSEGSTVRCESRGVTCDPESLEMDQVTHLSTSLTLANALHQHNVLGQSGVRSEHVGNLVVFAQYAAKAATLPAVMEAVWLSPDYASLAAVKRALMLGPTPLGAPVDTGGRLDLLV
jgi:hypothetical protein